MSEESKLDQRVLCKQKKLKIKRYKYKKLYKKSELYNSTDGEFGQKTGWLVKMPYVAPIGGETSVSVPYDTFVNKYVVGRANWFIRTFGKYLFYYSDKYNSTETYCFRNKFYQYDFSTIY